MRSVKPGLAVVDPVPELEVLPLLVFDLLPGMVPVAAARELIAVGYGPDDTCSSLLRRYL
jgi:hypothetical protein